MYVFYYINSVPEPAAHTVQRRNTMNSGRDLDRVRIVDTLFANLNKRRDTLDMLADAAIALACACTAFADVYKNALAAGWIAKELVGAGVTRPNKPTRRRRPSTRTQHNTNHILANIAEHE
jgi:hypothetical protein